MAESVATVWVPVDDMDRALRFYTDTLHLRSRSGRPTGARSTPAA